MDGILAIERNRVALKRILASLVAMAAGGEMGCGERGVDNASPQPLLPAPRFLPRHLYVAVLRLLRPAESAARRLIIAAARGLVAEPPLPRKSRATPVAMEPLLRGLGIAVVLSPAQLARVAAERKAAARRAATRPRSLSLPLFDPPRRVVRGGCRHVPAHAAPRIVLPGVTVPFSPPAPPSPDDPIDATRLGQRFAALTAALDDLPGQARRFARLRAARDAADAQSQEHRGATGAQTGNRDAAGAQDQPVRFRRVSPLRGGRPPGGRLSCFDPSIIRRRDIREIDEILAHAHSLALDALQRPDTS